MITPVGLEHLVELGRRKGRITTADVRQAMPVSSMTVEEVAKIVLELERAGIEVDLEPALLKPAVGGLRPTVPVRTTSHPAEPALPASPPADRAPEPVSAGAPSAMAGRPTRRALHALAAILVLIGISLAIILVLSF